MIINNIIGNAGDGGSLPSVETSTLRVSVWRTCQRQRGKTTYFLTDRKQPATVRADDIAMMRKQSSHQNNLVASLYGGVITPLSLVYQQLRQTHHQQIGPLVQLRSVGRSNSGSGNGSRDRRSPMHDHRFHPLSEEIMAPALIPPPQLASAYHQVPRFAKNPYLQQLQQQQQPPVIPSNQPNPPFPRHGRTPLRSDCRVHHQPPFAL